MGNSIMSNKIAVSTAIATGVLGLGFWIYKKSKSENDQNQHKQPKPVPSQVSIHEQLQKFKDQVDVENLSLQNFKKLLALLANYNRRKTLQLSKNIKDQRRKAFPKEQRLTEIREYFRFTIEGMKKVQSKMMELQDERAQLISFVGINQEKTAKYSPQLRQFVQQFAFGEISLQDLKRYLSIKTDYLQVHGQKIVEALIELTSSLSQQQKQYIPLFFNIIIIDSVFQNESALDKQEFEIAYEKYRNEIAPQLIKLEKVLMPLQGRLKSTLVGMGGYEDEAEMYRGERDYNEDQLGGSFGVDQQMMAERIEQLRMDDPQAYQQLMFMMQAQMGR